MLGIIFTGQSPIAMLSHWGGGFWALLAFSMQMALIVFLGYILADTEPAKKVIDKLASIPKTPKSAIFLVSVISLMANFINWGFGLIVGALISKRVAQKLKGVDYRLLIASSYSAFVIWHGGLSGSIPLNVASGGPELLEQTAGILTEALATSETIFSSWNLIISAGIFIVITLTNVAMHPKPEDVVEVDPALLAEDPVESIKNNENMTAAEKIESNIIIPMLLGSAGLVYIFYYFTQNGFNLTLDIVNFIFLILSIILHKTPRNLLDSAEDAVSSVGGILLQFPFYAGIMGMMINAGGAPEGIASLAGILSDGIVSIATPRTFPILAFLSAGIVNFFVPSGGGQWAVQAPILMPAGALLGVNPAITVMALAYGDAWTNLIQPFWALPALGIAGLGARDIMGYSLVNLLGTGLVFIIGLYIAGGLI